MVTATEDFTVQSWLLLTNPVRRDGGPGTESLGRKAAA